MLVLMIIFAVGFLLYQAGFYLFKDEEI